MKVKTKTNWPPVFDQFLTETMLVQKKYIPTSYESPDTQLVWARGTRAWHTHGGSAFTSLQIFYIFSLWGRGGHVRLMKWKNNVTSSTSDGLHSLRKKRCKKIEGMWAWGHTLLPQAQSSWMLVLSYEVCIFLYLHWFCQKLFIRRKLLTMCLVSLSFEYDCERLETTCWIFQICKDCEHKNTSIPKLNVFIKFP